MSKVPQPPSRPMAPPGKKIPGPIPRAKIPPPKMRVQETPEEQRPEKINNSVENQPPSKQFEETVQSTQKLINVSSNLAQATQSNQIQAQTQKDVEKEQISNIIGKQSQKSEIVQDNIQSNSSDVKGPQIHSFVQNLPIKSIPPPPLKKPVVPKVIPKAPLTKAKIPPPMRNVNQPTTIHQIGQSAIQNISNPIAFPQNSSKQYMQVSPFAKQSKSQQIQSVQIKAQPAKSHIPQKPLSKTQKIQQTLNNKPQQYSKKPQPQKAISQIKQNSSLQQKTPLKVQSSIGVSQRSPQKSALSKKLQQLKKAAEEMLKQDQYNDDQQQDKQDNQVSITPSDLNYIQDVVIEESSSEKITKQQQNPQQQQKPLSYSSVPAIIEQQAKKNPIISISSQTEKVQNEEKVVARSAPFRPAPPPPSKGTKTRVPPQLVKIPIINAPQVPILQKKQEKGQKTEIIKNDDNVEIINPKSNQESKIDKEEIQLKQQKVNSQIPIQNIQLNIQLPKIISKVKVVFEQPIKKNQVINQLLQRYHNLKNGYLKNLRQLDDLIHFQKQQQQHQIQKINSLLIQLRKKNEILRKACSSSSNSAPTQELQAISI